MDQHLNVYLRDFPRAEECPHEFVEVSPQDCGPMSRVRLAPERVFVESLHGELIHLPGTMVRREKTRPHSIPP